MCIYLMLGLHRLVQVHLRRLDDETFVHRRAVAMIRITASRAEVGLLGDAKSLLGDARGAGKKVVREHLALSRRRQQTQAD